ncbi:MAG: hypothetical protein H6744_09375 [Deltaproteobacteria bacterium]|nr:hypothetical protein [Deltaproteobacteria bacterium]
MALLWLAATAACGRDGLTGDPPDAADAEVDEAGPVDTTSQDQGPKPRDAAVGPDDEVASAQWVPCLDDPAPLLRERPAVTIIDLDAIAARQLTFHQDTYAYARFPVAGGDTLLVGERTNALWRPWIARWSEDGALAWEVCPTPEDASVSLACDSSFERPTWLAATAALGSGDVIVAGHRSLADGAFALWVARIDRLGAMVWQRSRDPLDVPGCAPWSWLDDPTVLLVTPADEILVVGSGSCGPAGTGWLWRLGQDGAELAAPATTRRVGAGRGDFEGGCDLPALTARHGAATACIHERTSCEPHGGGCRRRTELTRIGDDARVSYLNDDVRASVDSRGPVSGLLARPNGEFLLLDAVPIDGTSESEGAFQWRILRLRSTGEIADASLVEWPLPRHANAAFFTALGEDQVVLGSSLDHDGIDVVGMGIDATPHWRRRYRAPGTRVFATGARPTAAGALATVVNLYPPLAPGQESWEPSSLPSAVWRLAELVITPGPVKCLTP